MLGTKTVFLVGFIIGFIHVLLFSLAGNYLNKNNHEEKSKNWKDTTVMWSIPSTFTTQLKQNLLQTILDRNRKYNENKIPYSDWLKTQNLQSKPINPDQFLYSSKSNIQTLESQWLKSKVHITCIVFIEKLNLAYSINTTWGQHCNQLHYFSEHFNNTDFPIKNFGIKLTSSWQHLCEIIRYIWKLVEQENQQLEWVIFVRDHMMVIPENLRYFVATLNYTEDYYLGYPIILWGNVYNNAQAGFVLSRTTTKRIAEKFDSSQKCAKSGRFWKKEDYYLGKHLAEMGIYPSDTRDDKRRPMFLEYSLQNLLGGITKNDNYFTPTLFSISSECCSNNIITFSATEADKMYSIYYMLYHIHIHNASAIYGAATAATPFPDEDMWKIFLQREFNMTNVDDISSESYYKIWRSKYSETPHRMNEF